MRDPGYQSQPQTAEVRPPGAEEAERDVTRDAKTFTAAIRVQIFSFLRGLVNADYEQALTHLTSQADGDGQPWTPDRLKRAMEEYHVEHQHICLDPNARNLRHTYVIPSEDKKRRIVQQMLIDPDEHNDWVAEFDVDLAQSRATSEPALRLGRLGALTK
jgi:hypothetical protein